MESILYNTTDKEVTVILGYGIGSHLSLNFLKSILVDIRKEFPKLTTAELENLNFLEVADSSRRHKYHWYTRFKYDLNAPKKEVEGVGCYLKLNKEKAYLVYPHKENQLYENSPAETAASICARLTHD